MVLLFIMSAISAGQSSNKTSMRGDGLYNEIASMDRILFDAFNKRDTTIFNGLFSKDLEFYHDKGGVSGYGQTVNFLKEIIRSGNNLKRDLVKGSLEVYPIPGYGAMQTGSHRFCHDENGKQDCGTFRFVHIWKKENEQWKVTRVISYGH